MSEQSLRKASEGLASWWAHMDCRVDLPENAQWGEGVAQGYSNAAADLLRTLKSHPESEPVRRQSAGSAERSRGMTPAEELAGAADKLDALVDGASDGPWEVDSHKDMLDPGGPTWFLDGIERWRGLTNNVQLGEDEGTARYIAAMNPLIGEALASMMRNEVRTYLKGRGATHDGRDAFPIRLDLLDIARLINGS